MNNKHWAVIGALLLIIVFLALALAYAFWPHPAGQPQSETATTTAPVQGAGSQSLSDSGQYYDVTAQYPGSTPLLSSAGAAADTAAVKTMRDALTADIAQFKKDSGLDSLTAEDITMQGLDQGRKYSFDASYATYQGTNTVSYVFAISEDTLGAHPNTTYQTFTFNRGTGTLLKIGDLFQSGDVLAKLSAIARADLPAIIAAQQGSAADMGMLTDGTKPTAANFSTWYIDGSNLVLLFPPYQVGPYALGTVKDPIPLSKLTGLQTRYR